MTRGESAIGQDTVKPIFSKEVMCSEIIYQIKSLGQLFFSGEYMIPIIRWSFVFINVQHVDKIAYSCYC